jgi:hypothetical protein
MRRRTVDELVAALYATACLAVVLAPAVALHLAASNGGMGDLEGVDLLAASMVVGTGQAVLAWTRLRAEERTAARRVDMWIAAGNALVVLALGATLLPLLVLLRFPDEHASMANRGYPVVALWTGLQLVAVVLAEIIGRLVFWWLEPDAPTRWHPALPRRHVSRRGSSASPGWEIPRVSTRRRPAGEATRRVETVVGRRRRSTAGTSAYWPPSKPRLTGGRDR